MLEDQVLDRELQGSNGRDNDSARNSELEHKLILNQTSPNMKQFFMKYRCGSPRVLSRSMPRRHKNLFRYGINRSLNFDIGSKKSNYHHLPNASLDNDSFDANKSSRDLSRSAKIMRALSFDRNSFHHGNADIKKSLTFDSTPSPTGNGSSSSVGSSHADSKISTPSPISDRVLRLNTSSTDSSPNSILIASLDSIDENQNRTPRQNRKISRNNTDKSASSNSTSSYSSLRSNLKERIKNIVSSSNLRSLKRDNTPKAVNYDIATSTPRNLFQEFNQIDCDRSHTPENMIRLIPESMSAIKKSHKKERSFRHREQSAKQEDTSVRKGDSNTRTTMDSLEIDKSTNNSCNMSSTSEEPTQKDQAQKRNTNVKKMLVYNSDNEIFDAESFSTQRDTTSNIDSSDAYMTSQENLQDSDSITPSSSHYKDKGEEGDFNGNSSKGEECQLLMQKESPNDNNADATEQRNRAVSLESDPTTLQNFSRVITPENHVDISEHMFTESIKKSHRKVKHENRKALFKSMILHREMTISKPEMLNQSIQSSNDNQYASINSMSMNEMCDPSPQNSVRSHTPENVNSSRLLLSQFSSVKKSHRKDKQRLTREVNKRVSSSRCHVEHHECRKRNVNLLQGDKHKEENISNILCRDESHRLKESSPNLSPTKKKRSMNAFLQSGTHKLLNSLATLSPENENTDAEFRIYTPIRRRMSSVLTTVANCSYADVTSPEKDDSAQMTSKKADCSRCETPIARRFHRSDIKPRSKSCIHEGHPNIDRSKNDVLIIADNEPENIAHGENGRSTPLNMPTTELLCNVNSIKKSHKKNKHDSIICKRRVSGKEQLYTEKTWNKNFANSINMEKRTIPSLKLNLDGDIHGAEMGVCSNKRDDDKKDRKAINIYDDSQPCTSGKCDDIESKRNVQASKLLSTTPPNSWNTANFIKLLHTASIKKSHKKERSRNAQAKYIFMSEEHDLSDDGSIFDEKDKLTSVESFDLCQDNDNEKIHS